MRVSQIRQLGSPLNQWHLEVRVKLSLRDAQSLHGEQSPTVAQSQS